PPLQLTVMAASFHWMDRDAVLAALDRMTLASGGVAIISGNIGDGSIWSAAEGSWSNVVKEVVVRYLGPDRRAGSGVFQQLRDRHEIVLARSPFKAITKVLIRETAVMHIDEIVGLQLSTSYASPSLLGQRVEDFKRELADRLREFEPSGQ